jgi:hypothetical protein
MVAGHATARANDRTLVRIPLKSQNLFTSLAEQNIEIIGMGRDGMIDVVADATQLAYLQTLGVPISLVAAPETASAADLDANLGLYHTYAEMQTEMNNLVSSYPALASLQTIGTSIESRDIYALKISDNVATDESEPEVLIMGNLHARELMAVDIPLRFAIYLLTNYGSDATVTNMVDQREIFVIPMANPDGHVYVENNHIGIEWWNWWRKNRRDNLDLTFGVDLNRNFGYQWGYDDEGSSPLTSSDLYRGTGPFSEPESQAVRDFCNSRQFTLGFSYHSYGELMLFPWGYDRLYTADHNVYAALGDTLTSSNGYLPGNSATGAIYLANGNSDDWAYGENSTKPSFFLFTPEVNNYDQGGFGPPDSLIQPTFDLLLPMNMTLLEFADNPYRVVGPYPPTLYAVDHTGLTPPKYRLTWSGPDPQDPNQPVSYDVIEYMNISTVAEDSANVASSLWNYDGFTVSTARAYEGSGSYYSGAVDNTSSTLEAATFYRVTPSTQTFSAWVWYNIETDWDYAYFEVSADGGLLWSTVPGNLTTNSNPNGNNRGNGITGVSSGWVQATFSLSAYLGSDLLVRFNYVTDAWFVEEGLYIDLPGPVPTHESESIIASSLVDTSLVIWPTSMGIFTHRVRAKDAETQLSLWSNSEDENVSSPSGIGDSPAFASTLDPNFPNPFNPMTTIPYAVGSRDALGAPVSVTLTIYNIAGERVATLVNRSLPPGSYQAVWRGRNDHGVDLSSGVYFARLEIGDRTMTQKLVFLK